MGSFQQTFGIVPASHFVLLVTAWIGRYFSVSILSRVVFHADVGTAGLSPGFWAKTVDTRIVAVTERIVDRIADVRPVKGFDDVFKREMIGKSDELNKMNIEAPSLLHLIHSTRPRASGHLT